MAHLRALVSAFLAATLTVAVGGAASAGASGVEPVVYRLGEGVYRLDATEQARSEAVPSFSFEDASLREGGVRVEWMSLERPSFFTDTGSRRVVTIPIEGGTSLYGTGEIGGELERTGRFTTAWNTDAFGYGADWPSLYQAHPWVLAVRADGTSFGVLADTTYRTDIDLTVGIRFSAEGPAFPLIWVEGDSPQQVLTRVTDFLGRMEMPPKWAIGYHQCRWSYYPDEQAKQIAREFRERRIPADVLWHDIHYMDDYLVFTFDPERFPDPKAHNEYLAGLNFRNVWMIDPGVGIREGYRVYEELRDLGHAVKTADGEDYVGEVWPGPCLFPDYTNAAVRAWWAGLYEDFMALGIDGVWNDMNEPAVFDRDPKTMPGDNLHNADEAFGGPATHDRFHNVYGMLMAQATREGVLAVNPEKRPFVLTRANFIGGHRVSATWTGDNLATWEHLDMSIPMILNLGLSAQPFSGPDIGGFAGDGDGEQFARWMGFGALMPFSRGHTAFDSRQKEPWSFGPEVEEASRLALRRRYELMPFFYTLFRESSVTGLPMMRPLFFADPADPALREHDDGFLLGEDVLVFAHVVPESSRSPVFPSGIWRSVRFEGEGHPHLPEMYVRGGAIVPAGPPIQYVGEKPLDPLTLVVSPDEDGVARGVLYEDAGEGWGFKEGDYLLTTYEAAIRDGRLTVRIAASEGERGRPERDVVVRLVTEEGEFVFRGRDGEAMAFDLPATTVLASDRADDPAYDFGWIEGTDGGVGFGPWRFLARSEFGDGVSGRFIASRMHREAELARAGPDAEAFGLFANGGSGREVAIAERRIDTAANREGRVFAIDLEPGLIGEGGAVGFALASEPMTGAGSPLENARVGLVFNGGSERFTLVSAGGMVETAVPYTPHGVRVRVVFTGSGECDLHVSRFAGPTVASVEEYVIPGVRLTGTGDARVLRVFSFDGAGADNSNADAFVNRLRLVEHGGVGDALDITGDGIVDSRDAVELHAARLRDDGPAVTAR